MILTSTKESIMAMPISKLRGMSYEQETKLKDLEIYNSDQLLHAARTPDGRKSLAKEVGVETQVILELANRADLARVKGIGGVFSDLLEYAGVDTVRELARRRPDNLYAKLLETNAQKELAGRMPTLEVVEDWVAQAKGLLAVLEY
jgi:predicted flap endonuclease-1-like 5' DNA nuclease